MIPHYILHCRQCPGSELYSFSATKLRSQFPLTAQKSTDAFSAPAVSIILLSNTVTLNLSSAAAMHIILENTVPHMAHCRKAVTAFCHDRPIIFFIALCDPAVALSVVYWQHIQRRNCQRRPAVRTLLVTLLQKQRQSQLFCHDCPIIFFIALCNPAVAPSVVYRQHIKRRNLPCPTGTAALAVADFYNVDINVLESPCTSIVIVLFGTAHIYVNRDRSCHHTLACICRYSIAVADVVVLTDNVQL